MFANHAERAISDEGNAFIQCGMQSVSPYDNLTAQFFAPGDSPYARGGHHFSNGETWVEVLGKALGVTKSALPVRRNPHIAGGGGCIGGEMIRCWDSQHRAWTDAAHCAEVTPKPDNRVDNQSWPPVSGSALYPGAR